MMRVRSDSNSGVQLVVSSPERFGIHGGADVSLLLVQSGAHIDGGADDGLVERRLPIMVKTTQVIGKVSHFDIFAILKALFGHG